MRYATQSSGSTRENDVSNYISTASGRQFHFGDHERMVEAIHLDDVANALGNLCRFTGQCARFYSVAEHSWHVSHIVPPELALVGLLHDATEAYCADIARPLKNLLPDYQRVEEQIWRAVAEAFGLPVVMPPEIKRADMAMLKLEVDHLLPPNCADELNLPGERAAVELRYWDPFRAKFHFLLRFKELTLAD